MSIMHEDLHTAFDPGWNETQAFYPGITIHEQFSEQVTRTPGAIAVAFDDQVLTYTELDERSNQLAHSLQMYGVCPDTLVGVCMERSLELVIGLLAILKAGGAYVPLDPDYPVERLAYMLEDADPLLLLTQHHLVTQFSSYRGPHICLDTDWRDPIQWSNAPVHSHTHLDNSVYMIYTSGSTGKPKGVLNTHRALSNRLYWMQQAYQLDTNDRVLQKTPYSFDVSVWEFFWPLLSGATLVMARPGGHRDSAYMVQVIVQQQITTIHFVPSMLHIFLQEQGATTCTSLKRVICSGEALPYELQERFFATLAADLHNLYGPTEAAIDVTFWDCRARTIPGIIPIGYPIANIEMYILDEQLQAVAVGVPGELYIGGVGLARGYHNRPDLTADRFLPDPLTKAAGARLYKTGDLARYRADGAIEYLGRMDEQVKIHGIRIELGEIEAALHQSPLIHRAVVIARTYRFDDKRLIAYVVARPGACEQEEALDEELRAYMQQQVPEYMVPSAFVLIDLIPLTPSGKVDRKRLPVVDSIPKTRYVAPRTRREQKVADIWSSILQREAIGINANFFDLGGNSLLIARVISSIRQRFKITLTFRQIYEAPTVAKLTALIEQMLLESVGSKDIERLRKDAEEIHHD